jgi:hypothetical protein
MRVLALLLTAIAAAEASPVWAGSGGPFVPTHWWCIIIIIVVAVIAFFAGRRMR